METPTFETMKCSPIQAKRLILHQFYPILYIYIYKRRRVRNFSPIYSSLQTETYFITEKLVTSDPRIKSHNSSFCTALQNFCTLKDKKIVEKQYR